MSTNNNPNMLEGLGGPVNMNRYSLNGIDPALDECCQREVASNRKFNAMQATLRRHDVIAMAERRRRNLVTTPAFTGCRCCYDPNSDGGDYRALIELRERTKRDPDDDDEKEEEKKLGETAELVASAVNDANDDSDDEFDYLLDEDLLQDDGLKELEEARRAELEMAMLCRMVEMQHGFGSHRQMHPGRVLKAAGLGDRARDPPQAVVLHLVDADSMASASLDLYLEKLAAETPGTIFLRSGGRSTLLMDSALAAKAFPRLAPDQDMPALIAIRNGVVVNTCPMLRGLVSHDGEEIDSGAVQNWLDQSGVLVSRPPPFDQLCYIRPEEEALMDYMTTMKPKEEEQRFNCGLDGCVKSFPHEHVGVKTSEQDGLVVSESEMLAKGAV
jgi:hypothetical protein